MTNSSSNSGISFIKFAESLWNFPNVIKITYIILFFDIMFFLLKGGGLFSITLDQKFNLSLADLSGIVIALGIFSSLFLEILYSIVAQMLIELQYFIVLKRKNHFHSPNTQFVTIYQLEKDAMENGDEFSLEIYDNYNQKNENLLYEQRHASSNALALLIIFSFEWYLSASNGSSKMFIDWLWKNIKHTHQNIYHFEVGITLFLTLLICAIFMCWPRDIEKKIYYPRLAKKIDKERQKSYHGRF